MTEKHTELLSKLKPGKIILPVLIGAGIVAWLAIKDLNTGTLGQIIFSWRSAFWLLVAIMLIALRTFAYMARIRVLTDNELTWLQSFRIIMLWEFTSAITPSTVGGTAFAVLFLHKEGINTGRSTSVTLVTSFLDELYFVIMFPVLIFLVGVDSIFVTSAGGSGYAVLNNLFFVAVIGYLIIFAWVILVGYGLFFKPAAIKNLIISFFRLPFFRKWKAAAEKAGNEMIESSEDLKKKTASFWWKSIFYTFLSWTARYWIMNAILVAFFTISDHILIFARQLVLWIMMIISPTPGGSGFAEVILGKYISDLVPVDPVHAGGVSIAMALIWRLITYYSFLFIGVMIIPGWIARKFVRHEDKNK
jgi:uncharacterized protein (TIRG00374 family)